MSNSLQRSVEAANRVLQSHAQQPACTLIELELAAWTIGRAGGESSALPDASENLHVRLATMLGAGNFSSALELLDQKLSTPEGDKLLFSACDLAADKMAEQLIEIAHRHPDKWFPGPMLARTTQPERLLALFENRPTLGHAISTIGELVIVGRDSQKPIYQAETLWAEILRNRLSHSHDPRFRDTWLRITARGEIDEAIELLMRLANEFGRSEIFDGVTAVLARLVRNDPDRAAAIVASSADPWERLDWFEPLKWWFQLPVAAEPILRDLLSLKDSEVDIRLSRMLTSARAPEWLERSLKTASSHAPLSRAREFAPGISQLRSALLEDDAELARNQLLPLLEEAPSSQGGLAPRDLFDGLSAPGLPALVPWGTGPGLP